MTEPRRLSRALPHRRLTTVLVLSVVLAALAAAYALASAAQAPLGSGTTADAWLFSVYGHGKDLLRRPSSVAFAPNGRLYVADTGNRRVVAFDADGRFLRTIGTAGKGELELWEPVDVAVDRDGRLYVLDAGLRKIIVYDRAGEPVDRLSFPDSRPLSVSVSGDDLIVTTEAGVLVGDREGHLRTGYVARGHTPGRFDMPGGVAAGRGGELYVADSLNYRVQALDAKGRVLWEYGTPPPPEKALMYQGESRRFGLPSSIARDSAGDLYVVDGLNSEVVVLDASGTFVRRMSAVGHEDGELYYPDGCDWWNGRLAVADKFNDRVEVFRTAAAAPALPVALPTALAFLGLAGLGVLATVLVRPRNGFVLTPGFVAAIRADGERGGEVARLIRSADAPSSVAGGAVDLAASGLSVRARDARPEAVRVLVVRHGLDPDDAAALALCLRDPAHRTLLAGDASLAAACASEGVTVATYGEVAGVVDGDASDATLALPKAAER